MIHCNLYAAPGNHDEHAQQSMGTYEHIKNEINMAETNSAIPAIEELIRAKCTIITTLT